MATIKSYTDISQSKKLAEILPLESADMYFAPSGFCTESSEVRVGDIKYAHPRSIPCWSLAALINVLPTIDDEFEPKLRRSLDKFFCTYEGEEDSSGLWRVADNPVDACYEMIVGLNQLNLL